MIVLIIVSAMCVYILRREYTALRNVKRRIKDYDSHNQHE